MSHNFFESVLETRTPLILDCIGAPLVLTLCTVSICAMGQGFPPDIAQKKLAVAEGLEATVFASEPDIAQTIFVKCDNRGRLWTIQYLQYPNPAGLKRVKVDRWSRTEYDRVPMPPPHGPRGADRITICEDLDGDGRADRFKDFVDGLNLVTGLAFGHGGVFVLNVPYLLFYPDRDRDDIPDSAPEVLLTGFGMEDAQSMSNHLTWGPDGWLYGANGSTTTCKIRGIEFQSGVWRYHPVTKEFELFCEGGYNCYGLTFDRYGEMFYSTNGGPFIHAMQGAYYYKSFGKHGPLHNLYAYHHFPLLKCDKVPGGPPTGGTIYRFDSFPTKYHNQFIAGNFLGHTVSWWNLHREGSTFSASFGGVILDTQDTWSGPTDVCAGPDGSLYVSDFFDKRTAHPDPDAEWDRSNGRIYKIRAVGQKKTQTINFAAESSDNLIDLLTHPNGWFADQARVELASRRDSSISSRLREMALQTDDGERALQGLWGLNAVGCFDADLAVKLFKHPHEYVRSWAVRLLGDGRRVDDDVARELLWLTQREQSPIVIAQLACSAKRLPREIGLPVARAILDSPCAESDDRISWLAWWALESYAAEAPDALTAVLAGPDSKNNALCRDNALRLIRRWAAEGSRKSYDSCAAMIVALPNALEESCAESLCIGLRERGIGLKGVGQGGLFAQLAQENENQEFVSGKFEPIGGHLLEFVKEFQEKHPDKTSALELSLRAGLPTSIERLRVHLARRDIPEDMRISQISLLREVPRRIACQQALQFIQNRESEEVILAAIDILDAKGRPEEAEALLEVYSTFTPSVKSRMRDMFFSRPMAALQFLERVERKEIDASDTPISQLSQLAVHNDPEIDKTVRRIWGHIGAGTSEDKLATMRRLNNDLRAGTGDLMRGKQVFAKHCAICHQLHGEGEKIGPDLTTANRHDLTALLRNLVDPSAVIRREYTSYVVITNSGRTLTGLMAEQDAAQITILDAQNRRISIPHDEIDEIIPSTTSLMPEGLLESLKPQELRDLFHYLQN